MQIAVMIGADGANGTIDDIIDVAI